MSIEELENLRKQTVSKCNKNILLYLCGLAVIILLSIFVFKAISQITFMLCFIAFFPLYIVNGQLKTKYKNAFMKSLLPIAVKSILTEVQVDVDRGIPSSLISNTHSMSTGDRYSSSNLVSGKYKDINVMMSDVHIETESTDEDGHTTYNTIFLGQWMVFDFNKQFKSNVQVWEKKVLGGISRTWGNKLKKVELESVEFNKKFKVYSENEIEAFYIITPSLMEKITQVEASIKGTLMMVFLDNQLHVAVYNNKTTFNINIRKPIDFDKFAQEALRDLDAIVKFVDILDLDNTLFKGNVQSKVSDMKSALHGSNLGQSITPVQPVNPVQNVQPAAPVEQVPVQPVQPRSDLPDDAVAYLTDASDGKIDNF